MFYLKSIYVSLMSVRIPDTKLFYNAVNSIDVKSIVCPSCQHKGSLKIVSHYERFCIHVRHGRRVEDTVSVPLLACSCGHSAALLPDLLFPA